MWQRFSVLMLLLVLAGCTDGVLPDQREVVYFSGLETDRAKPAEIPDPGPQLSDSQRRVYEPILEGFEENRDKLLEQPDISTQIERIESVYVGSGRYLELVAAYQKDVTEKGLESRVADRLAWGYVRLGMQNQARELLDQLKEASADDPNVWFLDGAYYLQWDPDEVESQQNFIAAWERAIALDPAYVGFEGIRAADMRRQLERVKTQLGPENLVSPMERTIQLASESVSQAPRVALASLAPDPEPAEDAPVETEPSETESKDATDSQPEAAAVETKTSAPEAEYKTLIARGEMRLAQAKYKEAEDAFIAARTIRPTGFEAEFGQLRAGWGVETQRNRVSARARQLAERDNLSARQSYELGLFAYSKMSDETLARTLWERSKSLDSELAERVNIDDLLSKVK